MDPLNVLYIHFSWVLKLLTSHKCQCSHPFVTQTTPTV